MMYSIVKKCHSTRTLYTIICIVGLWPSKMEDDRLSQFEREASERYLKTTLNVEQMELGNKVRHSRYILR